MPATIQQGMPYGDVFMNLGLNSRAVSQVAIPLSATSQKCKGVWVYFGTGTAAAGFLVGDIDTQAFAIAGESTLWIPTDDPAKIYVVCPTGGTGQIAFWTCK